jgi:hypothetical protein
MAILTLAGASSAGAVLKVKSGPSASTVCLCFRRYSYRVEGLSPSTFQVTQKSSSFLAIDWILLHPSAPTGLMSMVHGPEKGMRAHTIVDSASVWPINGPILCSAMSAADKMPGKTIQKMDITKGRIDR